MGEHQLIVEGASRRKSQSNMKAFIAIFATLLAAANAEAEADPAVLYANAYGSYGNYGYGYGLGAYGYGLGAYGYGLGAYGAYSGYYGHAAAAPVVPAAYAYPAYAAGIKSAPCVNSLNIPVPCAARKRRDADAEADPAVLYGGYYGHPHAYNRFAYGYGYGLGAHAYGYAGLGYYGHYGVHPSHY